MPIFEYKCKECDLIEEHIISSSNPPEIKCDKGHNMEKLFPTKTSFVLKGNWYKTTKSY